MDVLAGHIWPVSCTAQNADVAASCKSLSRNFLWAHAAHAHAAGAILSAGKWLCTNDWDALSPSSTAGN